MPRPFPRWLPLFLALVLMHAGTALADGPFRVKNSHSLFLAPATPHLLSARCESALDFGITYSSTFVLETSQDWQVGIDMEALVLEAEITRTIGGRTEVGLYVPVISYNSGFLDGPLDSFHSALGLGDYGRSRRPENEFLFEVKRKGRTVIKGEAGGVGLGDARVSLKRALLEGDTYVSLYGFVELPTGDPDRGYGNGRTDWAVAVLLDKSLASSLNAYVNAGGVLPGDYDAAEAIELREYLFGALGIEWKASPRLALGAQVLVQGSPYSLGIRDVDAASAMLSFGARLAGSDKSSLELTFSEDLNTAGAPDFMLGLRYGYGY